MKNWNAGLEKQSSGVVSHPIDEMRSVLRCMTLPPLRDFSNVGAKHVSYGIVSATLVKPGHHWPLICNLSEYIPSSIYILFVRLSCV